MVVDICICTYKRPDLLAKLLVSISQVTVPDSVSHVNVFIVDNDKTESGRSGYESVSNSPAFTFSYDIMPEQNISKARNLSVSKGQGDFVIFVDDDEVVSKEWLCELLKVQQEYASDVVMGPVKTLYPAETPSWIMEGKFFEKQIYEDGCVLDTASTYNTLVKRRFLSNLDEPFNPAFGATGGEDTDMFSRLKDIGALIVASKKAMVYEEVLSQRLNIEYICKMVHRKGNSNSSRKINRLNKYGYIKLKAERNVKYFLAVLYSVFGRFSEKHKYKSLVKLYTCKGHLSAFHGITYDLYK